MNRLVDLLTEHEAFELVLEELRREVHGRRLDGVRARLRWLSAALVGHLELEEARLLPVFDTLEHPVANGSPAVIRRDHLLLRRLLDEAAEALDGDDPIGLCDALSQLAGVLEHHDRREARYLKPRLDEVMSEEAVREVLGAHRVAVEQLGPPPTEAGPVHSTPEAPAGTVLERLRWHLSVGQRDEARGALAQVELVEGTKGPVLADRVRQALDARDLVAAWEAARLLKAVVEATTARR